jgi:putative resolvase
VSLGNMSRASTALLSVLGCRLVVVDSAERDDDLVLDVAEIPSSFCARRPGKRGAAGKAWRMMEAGDAR